MVVATIWRPSIAIEGSASGSPELHDGTCAMTSGVKVFCSTKAREREALGERVTEWLGQHPKIQVVDWRVTQSSDAEFHCLTITLFFEIPSGA